MSLCFIEKPVERKQRDRLSGPSSHPPYGEASVIVGLGWHDCFLRQGQVPARFHQLFCIPSRLFLQQSSLWWSSLRQLPGSGRKPRVRIWRGGKAFAITPGPKPPTQPSIQPAHRVTRLTTRRTPVPFMARIRTCTAKSATVRASGAVEPCNPCPCAPRPCRKLLVTLWMIAVQGGVESGT